MVFCFFIHEDSVLMSHVSTLISTYESTDMIVATGGVKPQIEEDPLHNPKNVATLKVITYYDIYCTCVSPMSLLRVQVCPIFVHVDVCVCICVCVCVLHANML